MSWIVRLMKSSLGAKYVMALSGAGLFAFLIGHIAGNLLLYFGQDGFNSYAHALKNLPYGLLWIARGGLLTIFGLHVIVAYRLTLANRAARPIRYHKDDTFKASYASRTMARSGTAVLFFVIYHLGHFTLRVFNSPVAFVDGEGRDDVYSMTVAAFEQPIIALAYVGAMITVGFHLSHGLSSLFQSAGLNNSKYNKFFRHIMPLMGWIVCLAAASLPLAVLTGIIK